MNDHAENLLTKKNLRIRFREVRKNISQERKKEAKESLFVYLFPKLAKYNKVLSFINFGSEIDMSLVNQLLIEQNKLCIPKVENDQLLPYLVTNLDEQLKSFGQNFLQPDPATCQSQHKIDCILTPALVFDGQKHRVGYGRGCYDRFIAKYPEIDSFGIGFKEQLSKVALPFEEHDKKVKELCLV